MNRPTFYAAIRLLRSKLPCAYPVRVRTTDKKIVDSDGNECEGLAYRLVSGRHSYYLIRISRRMSEARMVECLLEEWSHCRAWNHMHEQSADPGFHGPEWGIAYAEVIRAYRGVK
jgi:hypothetical protein